MDGRLNVYSDPCFCHRAWVAQRCHRAQLAHAERDSVRTAYNYVENLPERRSLMQAWVDSLGALRDGGPVVTRCRKAAREKSSWAGKGASVGEPP